MVSRAQSVFDEAGVLKDAAVKEQLRQFMQGFAEFVRT